MGRLLEIITGNWLLLKCKNATVYKNLLLFQIILEYVKTMCETGPI